MIRENEQRVRARTLQKALADTTVGAMVAEIKTRQDNTRQDKTRQYKTRQDKTPTLGIDGVGVPPSVKSFFFIAASTRFL